MTTQILESESQNLVVGPHIPVKVVVVGLKGHAMHVYQAAPERQPKFP